MSEPKYCLISRYKKIIKLIIYIFLLICFFSNEVKSQWVECFDNTIYNAFIISFVVNGNNIFAGTYFNGIYSSTNNGLNWTNLGLNGYAVRSIAIKDNYIIAGAGECDCTGYGIYLSTNNGINWTKTNLNYRVQIFLSLAIYDNYIFAGTNGADGYAVYLSTNFGLNWAKISYSNLSTNNDTNWIKTSLYGEVDAFVEKNNLIFAGGYYGIFLSSDNGTSWNQTSLNNHHVHSLVVKGNNIFAGTEVGIFFSNNNGVIWKKCNSFPTEGEGKYDYYRGDISLASNENIIIAGINSGVYISTNNGKKWIKKNEGFPYSNTLTGIEAIESIAIINNYVITSTEKSLFIGRIYRRSISEFFDN